MDTPMTEILSKALQADEIDKIPSDIAKKLEKYYEDFMETKVLYDKAQDNNETLRQENSQLTSKANQIEAENEALKSSLTDLRTQLEVADSEVIRLTTHITQQDVEVSSFRNEKSSLIDERDQLLNMSDRKDNRIEYLNEWNKRLEQDLQSTAEAKYEALRRLDEIEGKEHSLDHKEKQMAKDLELKNLEIASLRDSLARNMNESMALQKEHTSTNTQLEIDLKLKIEELRLANSMICQLNETNQSLTNQCEEIAVKLKDQTLESGKIIEHYRKEVELKMQINELHKANSDDYQAQTNELTQAIKDLQRIVNETTNECGNLETKLKVINDEHQVDLDAKNEEIANLKEELKVANEMLKTAEDENSDRVMESYIPSAVAVNRRLRSGISFTEMFSRYYKLVEEFKKKEQDHNHLQLELETIMQEVQEKSPEYERLKIDLRKTQAINEKLTEEIDTYISERVLAREEVQETRSKYGYLERENVKLKNSVNDLARQVVYLMESIECSRGGTSSDQDQSIASDMPANEVISKKLVTFNNIVEMQENNQKLLLLVRDLSTKLEEMEEIQNSIDIESYEAKVASYEKRLHDAEESRRANEDSLANCMKERDRFKKLYLEIMKDVCKNPVTGSASFGSYQMEGMDDEVGETSGAQGSSKEAKDRKLADVEQSLQDKIKELKELKDEYNEYRNESKNNSRSLNEQLLAARNELKDVLLENCRFSTQVNFANEQIKTQQKNVANYKNKIETLEGRIQAYEKTNVYNETIIKITRDEASNAMKKLSSAESRCDHLQRENNKLLVAYRNLEIEHQSLSRERMTNSSLQNSLEMIKGTLERAETDSRVKMEQRLDDASRECSALRRLLQEEQEQYRQQIAALKSQTENSVKKMADEQAEVETLRSQLRAFGEQIEVKNEKINELLKKLQDSSTVTQFDNPTVTDTAKVKELQMHLKNAGTEIEKLRNEIRGSIDKETRLRQIASSWEEDALKSKEIFETWKTKMDADLETSKQSEAKLKTEVEELKTEIQLQITGTDSGMFDASAESKAQTELKEALQKLSETNRELRDLHTECQQLKIDLQTNEEKYSNEMRVHSSDLQTLALIKEELNKCQEQMDQLRTEKVAAVEKLETSQLEWENMSRKIYEDKSELEERLKCLDEQNTTLHDQLQAQHNKVLSNDSMNDSMNNSSFMNRSLTDEDINGTSSEKLLKIIKYLRKEKDLLVTKGEVMKNENTRLLSESELVKKRLTELTLQLTAAKAPMNVPNVASTTKYDDLMRKVEALNSMTESNSHLRAEKHALVSKVKDLTERVSKLEDESFPLQENNRVLLAKTEEQAQLIHVLRTNGENWKKRSAELVERNNKNPEDFKRLQNERENLAKMLTAEKENLRHLSDEMKLLKTDKLKVDQELNATMKQLLTTTEERKKAQDDLNSLRQTNTRLTQEIIDIKSNILKKEDEMKTMQNEITSKDQELNEIKNKELQIRRIAKKYKDSYTELKTKEDEREADLAAKSLEEQAAATAGGSAGLAAARAETERIQTKKIDDLTNQLASRHEEIDQLRKEIENLKKQDEKNLLAEARTRIADLTETNRKINRDYQASNLKLQTCEQSRSEHDSLVATLRSQLEAKMKELSDQDAARQETIARITRENDTLNTRVNQLHRQFQQQGSKPSTSSGTIEKSPSDPARTANVKPMATPSTQQSAPGNLRRGGDTPLASIRPMSVQNSRTAAVLPTSQTSNIVAVQGSSAGNVTTALVPPQQQVHTTGNTSTAEAMSSSPTSSHTDYMPTTSSATSSAVVVAVPPMGSTSAESTQEAESLSVNTNESSSSSSTSSQAVLQQQTVALVSPRIEVTPQNILATSQQVVDQNQAASTSGSSSSFLTAMSSHHQASSSNTVTTTQAGSHKRPRDAEGDSSTGVEESSASEKTSPQNKRTRLGEQTFQGVSESGLDVEYQVPTSSQRDQEDDVVAVDSDDDDEGMDDDATADVDEVFDAENGDTDEIESFGQDEGEGNDIDEPNDNNEVDVDDSSNAPNQSSSGAASSGARVNLVETIELSPLGQETQQIQTISSGSDAGPSGQANIWRQVQPPVRQQQQQQQNLVIQQTYEEIADDSIVPSTPTLYAVQRRADGFSEAVSSPHPTVPHASRFTFGDSGANRAIATLGSSIEGMDDTRIDLNLLDGSGDGGQSSMNIPVQDVDNQQIVVVDLIDESSNENKEADQKQPVAGPSGQAEGSVPQIMVTDAENDENTFDESASTSQLADDKTVSMQGDVEDEEDVGTDGVSSEGEKSSGQDGNQVDEGREAEASTEQRILRRRDPITWDEGREQQGTPHHRGISRGPHIRGQSPRGSRRSRRPYK